MSRILLIGADSKMPNLALMRISSYHKALGDIVGLDITNPDLVYCSVVFDWNKWKADSLAKMYPNAKILCGGPGYDLLKKLPTKMDSFSPDPDLYKLDYKINCLRRGCPRCCPWCVVWRMEGIDVKKHACADQIGLSKGDKLVLLDAQFLMNFPEDDLEYLIKMRIKVNFHQGLDIRLITPEIARLLRKARFMNHEFTARQVHFSLDSSSYMTEYLRGIRMLIDAGIKPREIMTYFLGGFNTSFEDELLRFNTIRLLGVDPYYMLHKNGYKDPVRRAFKRYVNRRIYKSEPDFWKYSRLNNKIKRKFSGAEHLL